MFSTIHTEIFAATEKVDRVGNKIRKPQAVCHYCAHMEGGQPTPEIFICSENKTKFLLFCLYLNTCSKFEIKKNFLV